jgi:hypothetical protein
LKGKRKKTQSDEGAGCVVLMVLLRLQDAQESSGVCVAMQILGALPTEVWIQQVWPDLRPAFHTCSAEASGLQTTLWGALDEALHWLQRE